MRVYKNTRNTKDSADARGAEDTAPSSRIVRLDDDEDTPAWRRFVRRILIGVALVVIGLVWSILNGTVWAPKGAPGPAVVAPRHGPIPTPLRRLGDMLVRPEVLSGTGAAASNVIDVRVTFHNSAAATRPVLPRDIRLLVASRTLAPSGDVAVPLRPTTLAPGAYTVGTLRFAHALAPGATLVYAPAWANGRSVRWPLYQ